MSKVAIIGIVGESVFLGVNTLPKGGETVHANRMFTELGGKGFNQAVAVARFGGEVSFLAAVGQDGYANSVYAFLKDVGRAFTEHGRDQEWLDVYQNLSDELKAMGRLKLYYAYALMNLNYLDKAKAIITPDFVLNDIREGESSITKLWQELYKKIYMQEYGVSEQDAKVNSIKKYPLPYELDYRMHD